MAHEHDTIKPASTFTLAGAARHAPMNGARGTSCCGLLQLYTSCVISSATKTAIHSQFRAYFLRYPLYSCDQHGLVLCDSFGSFFLVVRLTSEVATLRLGNRYPCNLLQNDIYVLLHQFGSSVFVYPPEAIITSAISVPGIHNTFTMKFRPVYILES